MIQSFKNLYPNSLQKATGNINR